MSFSLASAFTPGAMIGHFGYVLLVLSMLMRDMTPLRLTVVASALVAVIYNAAILGDPVGTFWEAGLAIVTAVQLVRTWQADRRSRFTPDEQVFATTRLPGLSPNLKRRLLDHGRWHVAGAGTVLTTEGLAVEELHYLAEGTVRIDVGGVPVTHVMTGAYIGEMSMFGARAASATAIVETDATLWSIPVADLRRLQERSPEIAAALRTGIAEDLRAKVERSNARRDGVTPPPQPA